MIISPLYIAIGALLMIVLLFNVIRHRLKFKVGFGDGNYPELQTAIRVHGNFIETAPLALFLIYIYETMAIPEPWTVHALGMILIIARIFHAIGLSRNPQKTSFFRFTGMIATIGVTMTTAILILIRYISV